MRIACASYGLHGLKSSNAVLRSMAKHRIHHTETLTSGFLKLVSQGTGSVGALTFCPVRLVVDKCWWIRTEDLDVPCMFCVLSDVRAVECPSIGHLVACFNGAKSKPIRAKLKSMRHDGPVYRDGPNGRRMKKYKIAVLAVASRRPPATTLSHY